MYVAPQVALLVTPDYDPVEVANWVAEYERAAAQSLPQDPPPGGVDDEPDAGGAAQESVVDELVRRWIAYRPSNAVAIQAVIMGLRRLGYQLVLSEPRASDGASRTYLRVLNAHGVNAGFMNSTSFSFVGTASLARDAGVRSDGRYPYIAWNTPGAAEVVVNVARMFMQA